MGLTMHRPAPPEGHFDLPKRQTGAMVSVATLPIHRRPSVVRWISYVVAVYLVLSAVSFFVFNDNWGWDVVWSYLFSRIILTGVWHTLEITFLTALFGVLLGILTAAARSSRFIVFRSLAVIYIWVMRAMPPLVMLLFVFFVGALTPRIGINIPFGPELIGLPANTVISRFSAAVIGLSIYLGAYSAEVFRGGLLSIQPGQFAASYAVGLSPWNTYTKVVGPQLIRTITPALSNEVITVFKSTSLVSVIGFTELLTTVQNIYAVNFETISLLTVAVIWYLFLTSLAMLGQALIERRFSRGYGKSKRSKTEDVNIADAQSLIPHDMA